MVNGTMDKRAYSVAEVAELTGLGRRTIWRLLGAGELRGVKVGKRVLIPAKALDELLGRDVVDTAPRATARKGRG